ncbi:hypothetical protein [Halorubrum sp. DTA46]|uniref:hypothetical protein n=1 Tax=Halorubrum sp. DTA46 TaxID=3402162 RepID=UPI003AAAEFE3
MVEADVSELEGERLRYNDDTWELTGTIEVKRNGELIEARARKPERVRGSGGRLTFVLDSPPASLNPGNLGAFSCELTETEDGYGLTITRDGRTDRYGLKKMTYE